MAASTSPDLAHPDEVVPAFELLFQHLTEEDRAARLAGALELLQHGLLDPQGIFVLREAEQLAGVQLCVALPGATALVWPPQVVAGPRQQEREDQLLSFACAWLHRQEVKLAQALMLPEEVAQAAALLRHGFLHLTHLWYLRHDLDIPLDFLSTAARLRFPTYAEVEPALFQQVLLRTYEDTSDCPEINGLRTLDEIISGHQSQGRRRPRRWWLALHGQEPVGVLITTELPESGTWDLSYLGVVPAARRRGFGRELLLQALCEARAAGAGRISLCVDGRNQAARILYAAAGFQAFDRREVFLAPWPRT